jgi:RNA recognition motif-containing protein
MRLQDIDGRAVRVDKVLPPGAERPVREKREPRAGAPKFNSPNRLYVGNLPWKFDDYDLEDAFSEFGEIVDAKVFMSIAISRVVHTFTLVFTRRCYHVREGTGRSCFYMRLDLQRICSRFWSPRTKVCHLQAFFSVTEPLQRYNIRTFIVSCTFSPKINHRKRCTVEVCLNLFFLPQVMYDREDGRSRGFGFVTLGSDDAVEQAISALDGAVRLPHLAHSENNKIVRVKHLSYRAHPILF